MTLLLTAVCEANAQAFFEELRKQYFPPERNVVPAHVALFHQLPAAQLDTIERLLIEIIARAEYIDAHILPPRSIGRGVVFPVQAPQLNAIHATLSAHWDAWLIPQDRQGFRPHIVVQNKVDAVTVTRTLEELAEISYPTVVRISGLRLWRYLNGPWELAHEFRFEQDGSQ